MAWTNCHSLGPRRLWGPLRGGLALKGSKSKAISVTGRRGLSGCKMLRIPHCLDNRLTNGGMVVSPTHRPLLYSPETLFLCFWYSFLLEAE
jgi:hypothetical protein